MRRVTVLKGGLLVCLAALTLAGGCWYLFLDTPSVTESELEAEPVAVTPAESPAAYSITASIQSRALTDRSEYTHWEVGSRYANRSGEYYAWRRTNNPSQNLSVAEYQQYENESTVSYTRFRSTDRDVFTARLEAVRSDVRSGNGSLWVRNGTRTYVHRERTAGRHLDVGGVEPRIRFLYILPYERAGTATRNGETVDRYVPTSGWVEGLGSTDDEPDRYVFDTSGTVLVDSDSGRIVDADLAFSSRRAEVRAGRWFDDGGRRARISYTFEESVDTAAVRPAWATDDRFDGSN